MNETPDTLRRRRRSGRKSAKERSVPAEPTVRALIEQALQPEGAEGGEPATAPAANAAVAVDPSPSTCRDPDASAEPVATGAEPPTRDAPEDASSGMSIYDRWRVVGQVPAGGGHDDWTSREDAGQQGAENGSDDAADAAPPAPPQGGARAVDAHGAGHRWVYLAVALFLLAIGFGLWGVWTSFFAGGDGDERSVAALRARHDKLSQEAATLRRSDQISRDANRDLERTLAERDEEIAGLRADIAFYERFVGATGQRRGLSVHDLDMRLQGGDAWHFVATLTQNVNRGAVNAGRITLSLEGTRNDRLERLSWSGLRKQNDAPGLPYSFKYFQQVEGEVMLPKGFKPLRVTVRLVPQGGSAVEQSFPWPETVRNGEGG